MDMGTFGGVAKAVRITAPAYYQQAGDETIRFFKKIRTQVVRWIPPSNVPLIKSL